MKTMKMTIILTAIMAFSLSSCSNDDTLIEQRDWDNTAYFVSSDEQMQTTFYKPYSGYVGDPMPFFDPVAKDFKVLYIQDYRPNSAGTYHPIWGVSTVDGVNYTSLGELISCGGIQEQDAALGTGSTIYSESEGLYYTFYTGNKYQPTSSDAGQAVMLATSSDFKTWAKDRTFFLRGNQEYSNNDFRDPFVFKGDDAQYHMLVATTKNGKGVIAEFVSKDLKNWDNAGTFMTMMWDRFYECPDVFKMGDWWYLVYSEKHAAVRRVQYFKGKTLDELKACTANDAGLWPDSHEGFLDSRGLYAGKTASDGTNRYLWGWCPTRAGENNTAVGAYPDEPQWGGNLVAYKLIQHEDGTLTLGQPDALSSKYNQTRDIKVMQQSETGVTVQNGIYSLTGDSYAMFNRLGAHNHISFTVTTGGNTDKFGISLARGSDSEKYYSMIINPENDNTRKINFGEEGTKGMGFVAGIDGYNFSRPEDNTYHIDIYTDNSVCVMFINGVCSYTNRIYGINRNCWSINGYGGEVTITNIKVNQY